MFFYRPPKILAKNHHGFTLLEVMVALAIFAIAALALLNTQSTQIKTDQHLTDKTLAHWVALNQLADMRLQNVFPEMGESIVQVNMAGQEWRVQIKTQSTPSANVRLLQISVALGGKNGSKEGGESTRAGQQTAEPSLSESFVGITTVIGFISRGEAGNAPTSPAT